MFRDAASSTSASRAGCGGVDVYWQLVREDNVLRQSNGMGGCVSGRAQEKALQESELRRKGGPQLQLAKARRPVSAP